MVQFGSVVSYTLGRTRLRGCFSINPTADSMLVAMGVSSASPHCSYRLVRAWLRDVLSTVPRTRLSPARCNPRLILSRLHS